MPAEVAEADVWRQFVNDELPGDRRQDHLTSVRGVAHALHTVDRHANVAVLGQNGLSAVEAHAYLDRRVAGPLGRPEGVLSRRRGRNGALRARKGSEEGVALAVDHHATVIADRPCEEPTMVRHDLAEALAPERAQQCCRPLDVCEQEGDRSRRELAGPLPDGRRLLHVGRIAPAPPKVFGKPFGLSP